MSAFQVYPFESRRRGEPRTNPPRTIGFAAILPDRQDLVGAIGAREVVAVCERFPQPAYSAESATGKVAFCNPQGETLIFQADLPNRTASLSACGNAGGASSALLAHYLNASEVEQTIQLPEGRVQARTRVAPLASAWQVEQRWRAVQFALWETELLGQKVAITSGTFNEYVILQLPSRADLDAFGIEKVLEFWREAERKHYRGFADLLRSRLAALAPNGGRPAVKFFTSGRPHPGAPLTGLSTLALAANQVSWLADLLERGEIEHRRGTDLLPAIHPSTEGPEVHLPAIEVVLRGL